MKRYEIKIDPETELQKLYRDSEYLGILCLSPDDVKLIVECLNSVPTADESAMHIHTIIELKQRVRDIYFDDEDQFYWVERTHMRVTLYKGAFGERSNYAVGLFNVLGRNNKIKEIFDQRHRGTKYD